MNNSFSIFTRVVVALAIVSLALLVTASADAQTTTDHPLSSQRYQRRQQLLNYAPAGTDTLNAYSNDAFTEPVEKILVACPEAGIVDQVKVKLGDSVSQDQVLVELDMSVLKAARRVAMSKASGKAKLTAAEVEFDLKSQRYQKLAQLYREGAGSPEEAGKARGEAEVARQNVEAILETVDQSRLETEQIDAQIERRRIRSPIDGVVVEITREKGEYISSADPHIATVVSLDQLKVIFYLPTEIATGFKEGDRVRISLPETDQTATAIVDYVSPVTNADSGRVQVDVLIDNDRGKYRSGVRCRIALKAGN